MRRPRTSGRSLLWESMQTWELKGMLESSQRATELMRKSGMRPLSPVSVPLGQCVLEKDVSLSLWVQFSDSSTF